MPGTDTNSSGRRIVVVGAGAAGLLAAGRAAAVLSEGGPHRIRIGALQVHLVDGNDDRHISSLRMCDVLCGLRHDRPGPLQELLCLLQLLLLHEDRCQVVEDRHQVPALRSEQVLARRQGTTQQGLGPPGLATQQLRRGMPLIQRPAGQGGGKALRYEFVATAPGIPLAGPQAAPERR